MHGLLATQDPATADVNLCRTPARWDQAGRGLAAPGQAPAAGNSVSGLVRLKFAAETAWKRLLGADSGAWKLQDVFKNFGEIPGCHELVGTDSGQDVRCAFDRRKNLLSRACRSHGH